MGKNCYNQKGFTQPQFWGQIKTGAGFTLIELLLYVSISAIILGAIFLFFSGLLQARLKNQTIAEVEQQGVAVIGHITQAIRNAENTLSPAVGGSGTSLTLDVYATATDPTIFDLSGGVIRVREGLGSAVALTNNKVVASGWNIQNLSRPGTPGTIRITFTLSRVNSSGRNEYSYLKTFFASASLRQP